MSAARLERAALLTAGYDFGTMSNDQPLREHILHLLTAESAHPDFSAAVKDMPQPLCGVRPKGFPHSAWELVEHLRIAQWDIIEYALNPDHVSPKWPEGYWPTSPAPRDAEEWQTSVQGFLSDLERFAALVENPATDLLAPIPHTKNATILRQALLAADHNAYHIGQLVAVRRLLDAWRG